MWWGQLGRRLVFHCDPGQPFGGLSQRLLTQVKHQALGAVTFLCCPTAAALRRPVGSFQKACFKPVVFIRCMNLLWEGLQDFGGPLWPRPSSFLLCCLGVSQTQRRETPAQHPPPATPFSPCSAPRVCVLGRPPPTSWRKLKAWLALMGAVRELETYEVGPWTFVLGEQQTSLGVLTEVVFPVLS